MKEMMEQIDQRYLLGELMPDSMHLEDQIYRELIRKSNKSVIERIRAIEDEKKEYREYIESWVHEIKAPITGIDLMCENHKETLTRRIALENRKIENYVDMALYYARSDEVYQDYMIRETLSLNRSWTNGGRDPSAKQTISDTKGNTGRSELPGRCIYRWEMDRLYFESTIIKQCKIQQGARDSYQNLYRAYRKWCPSDGKRQRNRYKAGGNRANFRKRVHRKQRTKDRAFYRYGVIFV